MRKKLWVSLKTAPFFIPFIIFKAGALAVIFAELKYGGLVHLTVWIILVFIGVPLIVPFRRNATPMFLRISNEDPRLGECVM